MDNASKLQLLKGIGLDDKKANETLKNEDLTATLLEMISEGKAENCGKPRGNLLYQLATTLPADARPYRSALLQLVMSERVKQVAQLQAAVKFCSQLNPGAVLDVAALERECGAGVVVADEQIAAAAAELLKARAADVQQTRYRTNVGPLLAALRDQPALRWADGARLKAVFDAQLAAFLGPRTPADDAPAPKQPAAAAAAKPAAPAKPAAKPAAAAGSEADVVHLQDSVKFPAPSENRQRRPELLAAHLAATGGRVVTRFPPEPNGFLHLGHAKAMNLSFGYAKKHGGWCYMRFDDTNPEKEKQVYIDSILDNVRWLGHKWHAVTYASDYFPQLYDFAVELIKRGKAYVDHSTKEQMAEQREKRVESPWRNRPAAESLRLFEDMRRGKFAEGAATLRLKMDMQSDNPNMRDLVAYRIKFTPHPHTGSRWCIYPSYDYTHPLCDSLENVTHSLCTLEFENRRENYNWLLDALEIYRPPQIEYSRLNLKYFMMSKRKLLQLVEQKYVNGWDDPRMPTLNGLRRRGYPPEALNAFCEEVGVTRAYNVLDPSRLEHAIRAQLDETVPRLMLVLRPLKVLLTNWTDGLVELEAPDLPAKPDSAKHRIAFGPVIYIDGSDFREHDDADYYGLAPNKEVGLKYAACTIRCTGVVRDPASGKIAHLTATVDRSGATKPKGFLHWVADEPSTLRVEVRQYDRLFQSEAPAELDDWLADLNPASLRVLHGAITDSRSLSVLTPSATNPLPRVQAERVGFYTLDPDSQPAQRKFVLNLTVSLKDSYHKKPEPKPAAKKETKK